MEERKGKSQEKVRQMLRNVEDKISVSRYMDFISEEKVQKEEVPKKVYRSQYSNSPTKPLTHRISVLKREEQSLRKKLRQVIETQKIAQKSTKLTEIGEVETDEKLKELTRRYRKFKDSIIEKTRKFQENEEKYKLKLIKLEELKMKQNCEKKKKKIEKRIKLMDRNRKIKTVQFQEQKKQLKRLKNKKKLYQRMTDKYNKDSQREESEKKKMYEYRKENNSVDMSKLSDHQEEYDSLLRERQQSRMSRLKQSALFLPEINPQKSVFYSRILKYNDEDKQEREMEKQKKRMVRVLHRQFGQKVERQHRPQITIQKHKQQQPKKQQLSRQELKSIGNKYFLEAKQKMIKSGAPKKIQKTGEEKKIYHNYISEFSKNREGPIKKEDPHKRILRSVKKIMEKQNLSRYEKIQEFKACTQQYYYPYDTGENKDDSSMLKILKTKIDLLQMIR